MSSVLSDFFIRGSLRRDQLVLLLRVETSPQRTNHLVEPAAYFRTRQNESEGGHTRTSSIPAERRFQHRRQLHREEEPHPKLP